VNLKPERVSPLDHRIRSAATHAEQALATRRGSIMSVRIMRTCTTRARAAASKERATTSSGGPISSGGAISSGGSRRGSGVGVAVTEERHVGLDGKRLGKNADDW
jgi:hypothetical protein